MNSHPESQHHQPDRSGSESAMEVQRYTDPSDARREETSEALLDGDTAATILRGREEAADEQAKLAAKARQAVRDAQSAAQKAVDGESREVVDKSIGRKRDSPAHGHSLHARAVIDAAIAKGKAAREAHERESAKKSGQQGA